MPAIARWSWDEWSWTIRNGIGVVAVLVLANVLSAATVFHDAPLGANGFNASQAVPLVGYGIALALIWVTAWRAATQIRAIDPVSRLLSEGLPPLATLIVLPGAYGLLRPFVGERVVPIISWLFVLLLLGTAVWLGLALYRNAEALMVVATAIRHRVAQSAERRSQTCAKCQAANSATARFCTSCGAPLASSTGSDDRTTVVGKQDRSPSELRRSA